MTNCSKLSPIYVRWINGVVLGIVIFFENMYKIHNKMAVLQRVELLYGNSDTTNVW